MAYLGNIDRRSRISRHAVMGRRDLSLWTGRLAACVSFVFLAVVILGL
ncbi:hypothetical protein DFO46_0168 [Rhizobium sp. AG855]|nr:hypothetical protein DFO46_0168 [Rhizobium sp. AG855]